MALVHLTSSLFERNRLKLSRKLQKHTFVAIHSNQSMLKSRDQNFVFHQNSDLFYFSGIEQERTTLFIYYDTLNERFLDVLFIEKPDPAKEVWTGRMLTIEQVASISGIADIRWLDQMEAFIREQIANSELLFLNFTEKYDSEDLKYLYPNRFALDWERVLQSKKFEPLSLISDSLRQVKEAVEIEVVRKAINITYCAFLKMLPAVKPGNKEHDIEALINAEFTRSGAKIAFDTIVASGENACILHYIDNNMPMNDGELVLVDFGASIDGLNADITRTLPVNGKFTERQKEVYTSVLNIQKEVTKNIRPGISITDLVRLAGNLCEQELTKLKLLKKEEIQKQDPEKPLYKRYFMHGIGHYLGIDVHDVGQKDDILKPGMLITCEPGIYIPEEKLGIRLENDILITENSCENLSATIPIEIDEIERLLYKNTNY